VIPLYLEHNRVLCKMRHYALESKGHALPRWGGGESLISSANWAGLDESRNLLKTSPAIVKVQ